MLDKTLATDGFDQLAESLSQSLIGHSGCDVVFLQGRVLGRSAPYQAPQGCQEGSHRRTDLHLAVQAPRRGIERASCRIEVCRAVRHTRRAKRRQYPDLDSNQGLDLRRVQCYMRNWTARMNRSPSFGRNLDQSSQLYVW